ncbi:hypothetical protein [Lentibacillus sp. CBA3610]|uniref:hypothetical protein n=1 Tax=Lentibacillus sp. CBA3610 TaxID=2518176 RepID=UPI001595A166|nr:hypothetical protein [Lentibacillus sp. CBA3610]QKY71419.1 hypothetical protein Len3610_19410 [Lentibacillus sp. CBA3610]
MKTRLGILILITIFAFVLSACDSDSSNTKTDTNTISSTDLSKMEKAILSTTSDESFVFNFNIDNKYNEMSVHVEKYKKGELVDDKLTQISLEVSDGEGTIIITSQKDNAEVNHSAFNIGISSGGSTGSTSVLDNDVEKKGTMGTFQENEISIENGEAVLSGIAISNNENNSMSFRSNFYEDSSEMKKYDVVYLFKAKPKR